MLRARRGRSGLPQTPLDVLPAHGVEAHGDGQAGGRRVVQAEVQHSVPVLRRVQPIGVRGINVESGNFLERGIVRDGNPEVEFARPGRNLFDRGLVFKLELPLPRRDVYCARGSDLGRADAARALRRRAVEEVEGDAAAQSAARIRVNLFMWTSGSLSSGSGKRSARPVVVQTKGGGALTGLCRCRSSCALPPGRPCDSLS
jgi:hypothetical protein